MEGQGRGVVATANYKAREYGIHSALPISTAWRLSEKAKHEGKPEVVFLPGNHQLYSEISDKIMQIIRKYSEITEQASIDESYIDLSQYGTFEKAEKICLEIKKAIKNQEKITASIGLGPNKLVAKIASDMQKPDGLTIIFPEKVEIFLEGLPIRKIPGIGPKTEQYFNKLKIYKVQDLKKYSQKDLEKKLGKWGGELYKKIRGINDAPVQEEYEIKSIGEQETFFQDTLDFGLVADRVYKLCENIIQRLEKSDYQKFRTVCLTIRFADFDTKTRSHTLEKATGEVRVLKGEITKLLLPFFDSQKNPQKKLIRLIGVRIEKLNN